MNQLYSRVFLRILDSSLARNWKARVVFEDALKLADEQGVLDITRDAWQRRTNMPLEIINEGIAILEAPDSDSRDMAEDGRRLMRLDDHRDWGWIVVNRAKYEKLRCTEDERIRVRQAMRASRERKAAAQFAPFPTPLPQTEPEPEAESEAEDPSHSVTPRHIPSQTVTDSAKQCGIRGCPSVETCKLHAVKLGMPDSEGVSFFSYYESNGWKVGRNPMRSWVSAMANWRKNWQERGSSANGTRPLSIADLRTAIQIKEQKAQALRAKHCAEMAMGPSWNNPEAKQAFFAIRREIKELQIRIEKMV